MIVAFIKTIIGIVLFAVMSGSVASILFGNEDERTNLDRNDDITLKLCTLSVI